LEDAAKVYFVNDRAKLGMNTSIVAKGQWLFEKSGLNECFVKGDSVAIKIHMGEYYNTGYLRPPIVRGIVEKVKEYGGRPFVTDSTTMLLGAFWGRTTARDYLETAARNGFTQASMGCPIVISDGEIGLDDVRVEVPNGIILKETFVAQGIADADAVIALSHFKGHDCGVYGGAIKNIGVGCASKRGKMNLHLTNHPKYGIRNWPYSPEACKGEKCPQMETCRAICTMEAYKITEDGIIWDKDKCIGCFACAIWRLADADCGVIAVPDEWRAGSAIAIADSAAGCQNIIGKEDMGFINYAIDISPLCDCAPATDRPVIPNLGVFASRDIVAIDLACLDMSMKMAGTPGSAAEEEDVLEVGKEKFTGIHPSKASQWIQINVGVHLGIGTKKYELIECELGPAERFFHPHLRYPDKPAGNRFRKYFKMRSPIPDGGFKYHPDFRITIEDLSKR